MTESDYMLPDGDKQRGDRPREGVFQHVTGLDQGTRRLWQ